MRGRDGRGGGMQAGPAAAGPLLTVTVTAALRHPAPAWEGPSRLLVQEGS